MIDFCLVFQVLQSRNFSNTLNKLLLADVTNFPSVFRMTAKYGQTVLLLLDLGFKHEGIFLKTRREKRGKNKGHSLSKLDLEQQQTKASKRSVTWHWIKDVKKVDTDTQG